MEALICTIAVIFLSVFLWVRVQQKRPKNFPPGPLGYPIVNNLNYLQRYRAHQELLNLSDKYGKIVGLYLGNKPTVVLNDWKSVKEAFIKQGSIFAGRLDNPSRNYFSGKNTGVIGSDGPVWKEQRRFFLANMRDFGFGKSSMEDVVMEGVHQVIDRIKKSADQGTSTEFIFNFPIINIIWKIVAGVNFNNAISDEESDQLLAAINKEFKAFGKMFIITCVPFLFKTGLFGRKAFKDIKEVRQQIDAVLLKTIDHHRETFKDDEIRDYVDLYLKEIKDFELSGKPTSMNLQQLKIQMVDIFHAGIHTVSATLRWAMAYMAKYPDIQNRIHKEIDAAIGKRAVSFNDRTNTVYTEATIMELQRFTPIAPLSLFHRCTEDTTLFEYSIPKDAIVIGSIHAVHNDPELWVEPSRFNPERFIENGRIFKPEYLIPFSAGKRVCPGESLARMELYLFFTTIMQEFSLEFSKDQPEPDLTEYLPAAGLSPHSIVFKKRT